MQSTGKTHKWVFSLLGVLVLISLCSVLIAQNAHQPAPAASAASAASPSFSDQLTPTIDSLMLAAVESSSIPGGVVCVTTSEGIIFEKAYGWRQVVPDTLPMTLDTRFDLASLSKPVGTAMAVMRLAEEGKIDLNAPVSDYLPHFEGGAHVVHLLTHTSGLPAYMDATSLARHYGSALPQALLDTICHCKRVCGVGEKENYSCLNYITLQHIVERVSGCPFERYVTVQVFEPLNMFHTGYHPAGCPIASTEILRGDSLPLCGVTHDPLARIMNNGVSGNAGVFSTAEDLALLAQFLLQNQHTSFVRQLTTTPDSLSLSPYTLGWRRQNEEITYMGTRLSKTAVAHTGYTGTLMVVDPANDLAIILLTNRVHPTVRKNINPLRAALCDAVSRDMEQKRAETAIARQ